MSRPLRGAALSPLMHWLLLVAGLALVTVTRDFDRGLAPIWFGAVIGMASGQLFAHARLKIWLAIVFGIFELWVMLAFVPDRGLFDERGEGLLALCAAMFSGYFSMTERGALLGLWLPVVIWMLPIVDGGKVTLDGKGTLLTAALVVMLVATMIARESRRVAFWQHSEAIDAPKRRRVVLREAPSSAATRSVLSLGFASALIAFVAFGAPRLWRTEGRRTNVAAPLGSSGDGRPCCEAVSSIEEDHVSELLSARASMKQDVPHEAPCRLCMDRAPVADTTTIDVSTGPIVAAPSTGVQTASTPAYPSPTIEPQPLSHATAAPTATTPPQDRTSSPPTSTPAPTNDAPTNAAATTAGHEQAVASNAPARSADDIARASRPTVARTTALKDADASGASFPVSFLAFAALALLFGHVATRVIRRLVRVRHLADPMWIENVDQRVSNLWELALVGLRDAGYRAKCDERPADFAERVRVEGMRECAVVLERARHGVRVDEGDLATMRRCALAAYRAAQRRAGFVGRLVGRCRWPLT